MNLQELKNELNTLINNLQISEFFSKIQEQDNIIYSETAFKTLQNKYILGKTDAEYYESLKTFTLTIQLKKVKNKPSMKEEDKEIVKKESNIPSNYFINQVKEWLPSISPTWQKAIAFVMILLFIIGFVFSISIFILKVSPNNDIKEAIPVFVVIIGFISFLFCFVALAKISGNNKAFQIVLASIATIFILSAIIGMSFYTYKSITSGTLLPQQDTSRKEMPIPNWKEGIQKKKNIKP